MTGTIDIKIEESDLDTILTVLESQKLYANALAGPKAKELYSGVKKRLEGARDQYKANTNYNPPA